MIKEHEFLSTIDYFNSFYDTKEQWCAAYHKDRFKLHTRSSQRIENTNKMLKTRVTAQISLNELFLRLFNLHRDLSNHDTDQTERDQMLDAHKLIKASPILEAVESKISCYAYQFTLLNLAHALSWKALNKPMYFKVYQETEQNALKVYKTNHLLSCIVISIVA